MNNGGFLLFDVIRVIGSRFSSRNAPVLELGWRWVWRTLTCLPTCSVSGLVYVIGPLICGRGHVCEVVDWVQMALGVFHVILSSRPADPPPPTREVGAIRISLTSTEEYNRPVFCLNISRFRRHFLILSTVRAACRWLSLMFYSCPLRVSLPCPSIRDVPCRRRCLAVQRCGSGV